MCVNNYGAELYEQNILKYKGRSPSVWTGCSNPHNKGLGLNIFDVRLWLKLGF